MAVFHVPLPEGVEPVVVYVAVESVCEPVRFLGQAIHEPVDLVPVVEGELVEGPRLVPGRFVDRRYLAHEAVEVVRPQKLALVEHLYPSEARELVRIPYVRAQIPLVVYLPKAVGVVFDPLDVRWVEPAPDGDEPSALVE